MTNLEVRYMFEQMVDMEELDLPQYRQRISLVAQDFCRYYLPVRYNDRRNLPYIG